MIGTAWHCQPVDDAYHRQFMLVCVCVIVILHFGGLAGLRQRIHRIAFDDCLFDAPVHECVDAHPYMPDCRFSCIMRCHVVERGLYLRCRQPPYQYAPYEGLDMVPIVVPIARPCAVRYVGVCQIRLECHVHGWIGARRLGRFPAPRRLRLGRVGQRYHPCRVLLR